jgi:acyl carrier protein
MTTGSSFSAADTTAIKEIVAAHLGKAIDPESIPIDGDLYTLGLTSLATVGLMLALEDRFDIEFPEAMLGRATFRSVANIADSVSKLSK